MALSLIKEKTYQLIGSATKSLMSRRPEPVFILGTGRCGTDLLLEILKANKEFACFPTEANRYWHPNSYPFSKRTVFTPPMIENPKIFTEISINNWPKNQEDRIAKLLKGFVLTKKRDAIPVIKSAMIVFMVPKIMTIFPKAKFIHIYRSGPSVINSFLKKEHSKYSSYYSDKHKYVYHCARYWSDCILEIETMKKTLNLIENEKLFELSYEELCERPEVVLRKLFNYLGIGEAKIRFDTRNITSRNYKANELLADTKCMELKKEIYKVMKIKGYWNEEKKPV